ncbi:MULTISPECIES: hypothetical protein [Streptomyces]|uniref:Integral membrane protein n=1 Tax=Streptomyces changanensis TaxID=2964669 RepID=A0ABY5N5K6_9ACTN|nr:MULTISPECIES: hypothetical protein [Streptomyces]UUS31801.1 hypothetical protein NRO40_13775 [Streptomyces changanensis]
MSSDPQYPHDPYADPEVAQTWQGQTWDTHYQPAVQPDDPQPPRPQQHHRQAPRHRAPQQHQAQPQQPYQPHQDAAPYSQHQDAAPYQQQAQPQPHQPQQHHGAPGYRQPPQQQAADATAYLPRQGSGAYPLPPQAPASTGAAGYDAPTAYLPPVADGPEPYGRAARAQAQPGQQSQAQSQGQWHGQERYGHAPAEAYAPEPSAAGAPGAHDPYVAHDPYAAHDPYGRPEGPEAPEPTAPEPAPGPTPAPGSATPAAPASATPAGGAVGAPADGPGYGSPTTLGNARVTDAQRARAEGRSPIIDPGVQPAGLTALLGLLLAGGAALGPYAALVPLVLLQAVTAAGWFRLNGMWPARQGIALAFLGGLVADAALLTTGREHGPAAILGTLAVWVLLVLVLQLRSHAAPEERVYGLMATVVSSALAVVCAGFLAAEPDAVVVGALAVAAATVARALPLPGPVSLAVALLAGAGAGLAAGAATGAGPQAAVLGLAAGACAVIGLRVAAYDYPSRFVHMTAGVALPLALAAPAVYLLGRTLV